MARTNKRIGVLWSKQSRDGKTAYWSGFLDNSFHGPDIPIVVFRTEKPAENSPDFVILLSEPRAKADLPAAEEAEPVTGDEPLPF